MPFLPITALYACLLALLLIHLAYQVVAQRIKHKSGLGHSEQSILLAGRNHANASEYIPIALILLALAELNGASMIIMHITGASFFIARLAHAWGFKAGQGGTHTGRYWGTVLTWVSIVALCLINMAYVWRYIF
ncbi:hypothetical protein A9Q73_07660 [Bermanella sp. 47_1433_sub80_T6]|nr:hypothetical protein A9Q73_07660 [Bermanella sp. 47_1433_sub80_T6]